jgi:hypothetical protein
MFDAQLIEADKKRLNDGAHSAPYNPLWPGRNRDSDELKLVMD